MFIPGAIDNFAGTVSVNGWLGHYQAGLKQAALELEHPTGSAGETGRAIGRIVCPTSRASPKSRTLTRLYLIAALSERLTQVRQILIVTPAASRISGQLTGDVAAPVNVSADEQFVGQLSTAVILSVIGPKVDALGKFRNCWLKQREVGFNEVGIEIHNLLEGRYNAFGDSLGNRLNEENAKIKLTPEVKRACLIRDLDQPSDCILNPYRVAVHQVSDHLTYRKRKFMRNVLRLAMILLLTAFILTPWQSASDGRTFSIAGQSEYAKILEINGKSYVEVADVARLTRGSISFSTNQVLLSSPAQPASAAASQATQGFSKEFRQTGIELMSSLREWRITIVNSIQNNFPVSEEWVSEIRALRL